VRGVRKEVQLHTDEKRKERKGNRDVDDREMVECVTGYLSVDVLTRIVEVQTNSLLTSLATLSKYPLANRPYPHPPTPQKIDF
jgi:hypothetical protein